MLGGREEVGLTEMRESEYMCCIMEVSFKTKPLIVNFSKSSWTWGFFFFFFSRLGWEVRFLCV
jgi:hypothetical protein